VSPFMVVMKCGMYLAQAGASAWCASERGDPADRDCARRYHIEPAGGAPGWEAVLGLLEQRLAQPGLGREPRRARVVIADQWVRYTVVPLVRCN